MVQSGEITVSIGWFKCTKYISLQHQKVAQDTVPLLVEWKDVQSMIHWCCNKIHLDQKDYIYKV